MTPTKILDTSGFRDNRLVEMEVVFYWAMLSADGDLLTLQKVELELHVPCVFSLFEFDEVILQ